MLVPVNPTCEDYAKKVTDPCSYGCRRSLLFWSFPPLRCVSSSQKLVSWQMLTWTQDVFWTRRSVMPSWPSIISSLVRSLCAFSAAWLAPLLTLKTVFLQCWPLLDVFCVHSPKTIIILLIFIPLSFSVRQNIVKHELSRKIWAVCECGCLLCELDDESCCMFLGSGRREGEDD